MIWASVKRVFFIGISSFILPRKFYFRIPLRSGGITEWDNRPSENEIKRFEDTFPVSVYSAFHFCEHLGKVHETV